VSHLITEYFGGGTAEPEHDQRAEHGVVHDADEDLDAPADHGLDKDTAEPVTEPGGQPAVGAADVRGVRRSSSTALAAVLCTRPGTSALCTTGLPRSVAAVTAVSSLSAGRAATTGSP
jgi:hypothetical protein